MKTIDNELNEFYQAWYYDLHPHMQPVFKEQLLSLLKSVAEAQREADSIEVNSTHGALFAPLVTDK